MDNVDDPWEAVEGVFRCEAAIDEMESELAALRKDAERYRWLRTKSDPDSEQPYVTVHTQNSWGKWYNSWEAGEDLDRAIDAAMAASK